MKYDDTKEKARVRQVLKDKVKKIVAGQNNHSTTLPNEQQKTFVTGGGLPGKPTKNQTDVDGSFSSASVEDFSDPEDLLLHKVDQYHKDFTGMLTYLTEVDDMFKGGEMSHLRQMKDISGQRLKDHH